MNILCVFLEHKLGEWKVCIRDGEFLWVRKCKRCGKEIMVSQFSGEVYEKINN